MITTRTAPRAVLAVAIAGTLTAVSGCVTDTQCGTDVPSTASINEHDGFQVSADAWARALDLVIETAFRLGELDPRLISEGQPMKAVEIRPGTEAGAAVSALIQDQRLADSMNRFVDDYHDTCHFDGSTTEPPTGR